MPLVLTPVVLQLIQMGITLVPQLINAAVTEINLIKSGLPPTPAQQKEIDDALDAAHAALQAAANPPPPAP